MEKQVTLRWLIGLAAVLAASSALAQVEVKDAWIRATASEMGLIYADYPSVLANAGRPIRSDFSRDGVHPTAKGYAAMRPVAEAALARVLGDGYPVRAEAPQ